MDLMGLQGLQNQNPQYPSFFRTFKTLKRIFKITSKVNCADYKQDPVVFMKFALETNTEIAKD